MTHSDLRVENAGGAARDELAAAERYDLFEKGCGERRADAWLQDTESAAFRFDSACFFFFNAEFCITKKQI